MMHEIRLDGNKAVHNGDGASDRAVTLLRFCHTIARHIAWQYLSIDTQKNLFIVPTPATDYRGRAEKLQSECSRLEQDYAALLEQIRQKNVSDEEKAQRKKKILEVVNNLQKSEAETRVIIDAQLRAAGWLAESATLRYSKGTRPEKGKNIAIAEWPTGAGPADYALFYGTRLLGIIEAKKENKDVVSDLGQAEKYANSLMDYASYLSDDANECAVPFAFSTNGRPYLEQVKEKSGIWSRDRRSSKNLSRVLQSWFTPDGLNDLLKKDTGSADKKLKAESFDYLKDKQGLGLYGYQEEAIHRVEENISKGANRSLLVMATGTGKTRTSIGMIYRLLKSERFKKILFIVDRTSLGSQANDAFKDASIEDLKTFTQIYDVAGLDKRKADINTKVHITTVQGLIRRIFFTDDPRDALPVDAYDCVIVDEAHRGYFLDKELGEEELLYKNQWDYVSIYRQAIEYFDAHRIGLTATPAKHTEEIFGAPVFSFSYREAVLQGVLVDHDPPHIIKTELYQKGIGWKKGDAVKYYDQKDKDVKEKVLEDELKFDVADFNKQVLTENFNRAVIEYLKKHINPDGPQKTLIFAANNTHADMVVRLLKEAFVDIDDDAIRKITASVKDPEDMINRYKKEAMPTIAVTVDLLTTGIDVPEICNIVFLRRVNSRILYEQMIGRATRLCSKIGKDHFEIFDAVGLYEIMEKFSDMQPVVQQPTASMKSVIDDIARASKADSKDAETLTGTIIAKLYRKARSIDPEVHRVFKENNDSRSIADIAQLIEKLPSPKRAEYIRQNEDLLVMIGSLPNRFREQYISNHEDKVAGISREYGTEGNYTEKPEDYIEKFTNYIETNKNEMIALKTILQKPAELTRKDLKELTRELDKAGYKVGDIAHALSSVKNADMALSIVGIIRQLAIGDSALPHNDRVDRAVKQICDRHDLDARQKGYLERIALQIKKEIVVDRSSFDEEPFKKDGGFKSFDRILDGELETILTELYRDMYNIS